MNPVWVHGTFTTQWQGSINPGSNWERWVHRTDTDYENHLTSVSVPGTGNVNFAYDPFGRRILKSSATVTAIYAYDGDNVVEELDAAGGVAARYAQGLGVDEPLATYRGATASYYHADGLGSVTSLTDGAGTVAASYVYDSFGNLSSSTGTLTNSFRYTGREFDSETGLYYYRARYYDPTRGQFISEDLNKDGVAGSLYMYVENSPAVLVDPFGTQSLVVGSKTKPEEVSAFNAGFAEALNRLKNSDCRKLFCKDKNGLDPGDVLRETEYRIFPFPDNPKAGAQKNSSNSVFINKNGPFFGKSPTIYIPNDKPGITSLREVPFRSLDQMRAFMLFHELGHQIGIFPADLFPFINGTHSLRVLEACFKDVRFE